MIGYKPSSGKQQIQNQNLVLLPNRTFNVR